MGNSVEQLEPDEPLVIEANPFGGAEVRWVASPVRTALAEVIHQIDCGRRLIVVTGKAGTGKTLLTDMVVRACSDRGLLTCRIDRGDLADVAHRAPSDVVVVDEADSITDLTAQAFLSPGGKTATTCVLLCLPTALYRFGCPDSYVVDLPSLSLSDARTYLLERAKSIGHPHLFAPEALDLVIYRARGSFRLLRSIASLAFFDAAHEGETQIAVRHVAYALESQMVEDVDENDIALRSHTSYGDRADEADRPKNEPVVDALEAVTSHVDEGEKLHADVSGSDSADESGGDLGQRVPIGGALEAPTPYVDEGRIDLESQVLPNKSACQTETSENSQPEPNWHRLIPSALRNGNERVGHLLRRTDIRWPIGLVVEPIPDLGTGPYRLSARMRKAVDDPVSSGNRVTEDHHIDIEPISDRRFPVLGIALAGLLVAALIYSRDEIVSFATRTFERATEEGLVQRLVDAVVPPSIGGQTQVAALESISPLPFEVPAAEPVSLRAEPQPPIPAIVGTRAVSPRPEFLPPIPLIAVTQPVSVRPELLPPIPLIAVTRPVSVRPELLPPIPLLAVTRPVSVRPDLLPPIPVIAVTRPVSVRPELLPPIPQIAVTRPVSLRADLAAAVIRQTLVAAAAPVPTQITVTSPVSLSAESVQVQLPPGRRYGLQNRNSRVTLRVHRPTIVAIRDARNRIFIDRELAPGDTYRVPNLVNLWLTAIDASAVEIILDGASVGFVGAQSATVRDLSLNPQTIADQAIRTSSQTESVPTVQAGGDPTEVTGGRAEGVPLE